MGSYWRSVTSCRVLLMMTMLLPLLLLLLLVGEVSAMAVESGDEAPRTKRQTSSTCEAKYRELSTNHSRCLEDVSAATLTILSQADKDDIVRLHNDIRANVTPTATDMMKMIWNNMLAGTAEKWAKQCDFNHDEMNNRLEPDWPGIQIGQNMGLGHKSFAAMLDRFYSEKERFNYVYGGVYTEAVGHYFQLVSYESVLVGCAEVRCSNINNIIRVCNYAPAINAAIPPYKNGTWCGDCPNKCDSSGRLCDCGGKLCYNNGNIKPDTCQCECQRGKTGENCENVDCIPEDLFSSCRNGVYSKADCSRMGSLIQDPTICPRLCGLCDHMCGGKKCQEGHQLNYSTCECKCVGSYCDPCRTVQCQNHGTLVQENCTCTCLAEFTGATCEICPAADASWCAGFSTSLCNTPVMATQCPYACKTCPTSGQQTTTTGAPTVKRNKREEPLKMSCCLPVLLIVMVVAGKSAGCGAETTTTPTNYPPCEAKYLALNPSHTRCLTDNVNATLVRMSKKNKKLILKIHNGIRTRVDPAASNMMKLKWDDTLAKTAEKWVMQCNGNHDLMRNRLEPDWPGVQIGQNMGLGHSSFRTMVNRFYSEKARTGYIFGGGYIPAAGHFWQLVSYDATRIGCAMAQCPQSRFRVFRVCNYAPAGRLCHYGGDLDPRTCQCKCQPGRTGDNCELSDCERPDVFPACRDGRYTEEDCGRIGSLIEDPHMCPHLCGVCPKPCGGLQCHNGGTLDWDTCQCHCPGRLTGPTCESCPPTDKETCTLEPRSYCQRMLSLKDCPIYCGLCNKICPAEDDVFCHEAFVAFCNSKYPPQFSFMQANCPYLCGLCPRA
ncbi:hypothetical protein ACOMHN_006928 [Nucella lapillus]